MVMADGESPYKKGDAYPKSFDSDAQLLVEKLSTAGLSGSAQGSKHSGRSCKRISTHGPEEQQTRLTHQETKFVGLGFIHGIVVPLPI
jgi:hypothetical protein